METTLASRHEVHEIATAFVSGDTLRVLVPSAFACCSPAFAVADRRIQDAVTWKLGGSRGRHQQPRKPGKNVVLRTIIWTGRFLSPI